MRRFLSAVLAVSLAGHAWHAHASDRDYPTRPIRLVVTNTAGVADDVLGRALAQRLSELLKQQIVVINQAGAGGMIAAQSVAKAPPDGYTLMVTSLPAQVVSPQIYARVPYDPMRDFVPVAMFASMPNVLVVSAGSQFRSVSDLVAHAKANAGQLVMSNAGQGFQSHLANVGFASQAGISVLHVPYKGAASLQAVMAGEAQATIAPGPSVSGPMKGGLLRGLAVGTPEPSPLFPELPSFQSAGIKGFTSIAWTGIVAPQGTPKAIVDKLEGAIARIAAEPSIREQFSGMGAVPWYLGQKDMQAFVASEFRKYGAIVRMANITVQ